MKRELITCSFSLLKTKSYHPFIDIDIVIYLYIYSVPDPEALNWFALSYYMYKYVAMSNFGYYLFLTCRYYLLLLLVLNVNDFIVVIFFFEFLPFFTFLYLTYFWVCYV